MTLFKGCHYPKDVIMQAIRWYVAYPLSYRHVEELLEERGIFLDHATVNRWVLKKACSIFTRNLSCGVGEWMRQRWTQKIGQVSSFSKDKFTVVLSY